MLFFIHCKIYFTINKKINKQHDDDHITQNFYFVLKGRIVG